MVVLGAMRAMCMPAIDAIDAIDAIIHALTGASGQGSCNFCEPGPARVIVGLVFCFIQ